MSPNNEIENKTVSFTYSTLIFFVTPAIAKQSKSRSNSILYGKRKQHIVKLRKMLNRRGLVNSFFHFFSLKKFNNHNCSKRLSDLYSLNCKESYEVVRTNWLLKIRVTKIFVTKPANMLDHPDFVQFQLQFSHYLVKTKDFSASISI